MAPKEDATAKVFPKSVPKAGHWQMAKSVTAITYGSHQEDHVKLGRLAVRKIRLSPDRVELDRIG